MAITLYGIAGCDTVKKARRWLDGHAVDYRFHDYRQHGIDTSTLAAWCGQFGWEALINKRGTTWRRLDAAERADLDERRAIALMQANTSLIRRPLAEHEQGRELGFDEERYAALFNG